MIFAWNKLVDGLTNRLTRMARKGQTYWYLATAIAILFIGLTIAVIAFLFISVWLISSFLVDSTHYYSYYEGLVVKLFLSLILFGCLRLFNSKQ